MQFADVFGNTLMERGAAELWGCEGGDAKGSDNTMGATRRTLPTFYERTLIRKYKFSS